MRLKKKLKQRPGGLEKNIHPAGVLADLVLRGFGPAGLNPLADLVRPRTISASGFGPPSRIWSPSNNTISKRIIRIISVHKTV